MRTKTRLSLIAGFVALFGVFAIAAITLVEHSAAPSDASMTATGASIGGPFTLVGADGQAVTDQSFRGKWMLVYFGYTFCPDVCPTTLNNIAQALVQLGGDAKNLVPVFISIDPKRDTPPVVGAYVKAFDPRIVGLTGNSAQVAAVAKEYRVYYAAQPGNGNDYLIDHSAFVYLMSPQGTFAKVMAGSLAGGEMADTIAPFLRASS